MREAYPFFTSQEPRHYTVVSNIIWLKHVPLKISLFVWRLLHNRWPTKDNLFWWDIIHSDSQLCLNGFGKVESIDHLFLDCNVTSSLWYLVSIALVLLRLIPFEFWIILFNLVMQLMSLKLGEMLCTWVIWKARNDMFFNNNRSTTYPLLKKKIKFLSFLWLKANNAHLSLISHSCLYEHWLMYFFWCFWSNCFFLWLNLFCWTLAFFFGTTWVKGIVFLDISTYFILPC